MGMHGYGGQHVVIDFDNSRIVVANAIHENFNYPKTFPLKSIYISYYN